MCQTGSRAFNLFSGEILGRYQEIQEQRRKLIREQLKETPEKSDRQIAKDLGIHHTTVATQRHCLEKSGDVAKLATSVDSLGREQPRQRKPVSVFNPTPREEKAVKQPPHFWGGYQYIILVILTKDTAAGGPDRHGRPPEGPAI